MCYCTAGTAWPPKTIGFLFNLFFTRAAWDACTTEDLPNKQNTYITGWNSVLASTQNTIQTPSNYMGMSQKHENSVFHLRASANFSTSSKLKRQCVIRKQSLLITKMSHQCVKKTLWASCQRKANRKISLWNKACLTLPFCGQRFYSTSDKLC